MERKATKDYLLIPNEVMITKGHVLIPPTIIAAALAVNLFLFVFYGYWWNMITVVITVPILVMTINMTLKLYSPTTGFVSNEQ